MKSASGLAKNVTKCPTSSMVPKRPTELGSISWITFFSISFQSAPQFFSLAIFSKRILVPVVTIGPGETVLTVIPVPASSLAKLRVILMIAAFVAP